MELKWDGTVLPDGCIVEMLEKERDHHEWSVEYNGKKYICRAVTSRTLLPCVLDEMKRLFKISNLGTHHVRKKGQTWILYRLYPEDTPVKFEVFKSRTDLHKNPAFIRTIQRLLIFKEIFGVCIRSWNHIEIRTDANFVLPVSVKEIPNYNVQRSMTLRQSTILKWFRTSEKFTECVKEFLSIFHNSGMAVKATLESIINRIDNGLSSYANFVYLRLLDLTGESFNDPFTSNTKEYTQLEQDITLSPEDLLILKDF